MERDQLAGLLKAAASELEGKEEEDHLDFVQRMYLPRIGNVSEFYMGNMSWVRKSPLRVSNDLLTD